MRGLWIQKLTAITMDLRLASHLLSCFASNSARASWSRLVPLTRRPRASCCCFRDSVCLEMASVERLSCSMASLISCSLNGWTDERSVDAASFWAPPDFSRALNLAPHQTKAACEREGQLGVLLIQLVDGQKRVGADMKGYPVAEKRVVRIAKRGPHRCCIDRRVICPQGPDQRLCIHRKGRVLGAGMERD